MQSHIQGNPGDRRLPRLGTDLPLDKRISYDPAGRLRQTVINGVTTQFLYSGNDLIAEMDGAGAILRRYVHGPGVNNPLVWIEGPGMAASGVRYLYKDRLGSITSWTNAAGVVQATFAYGPYGEPKTWGGSRFGYTGQVALSELGLYHYHNRVYDPVTGRFLQTDPIGYGDGPNMYIYAHGDPVNQVDPLGLCIQGESGSCIEQIVVTALPLPEPNFVFVNPLSIVWPGASIPAVTFGPIGNTSNTRAAKGGSKKDDACDVKPGPAGNLTNLVGAAFAAAAYVAGKIQGTNPQILPSPNGINVTNSPLNIADRAATLGNFSIYPPGSPPSGTNDPSYSGQPANIGRHEDGHKYQATALGDLYLPMIALSAMIGGDKSPMELEADKYANGNCNRGSK